MPPWGSPGVGGGGLIGLASATIHAAGSAGAGSFSDDGAEEVRIERLGQVAIEPGCSRTLAIFFPPIAGQGNERCSPQHSGLPHALCYFISVDAG